MELKRNCPKCNKEIYYKRQGDLYQGNKNNTICKQCVADNRIHYKPKIYERKCPNCKCVIKHSNLKFKIRAEILKTKCRKCSSPFKGNKNKKLSNSLNILHNKNISYKNCKVCDKNMKLTLWEKNRIYCSKKCYFSDDNINKGKFTPSFNKKSCEFFDKLNKDYGWRGVYGTNQGEKKIKKYWVDYYEPKLNIVIEWDEKYHNNLKQNEKDMTRCLEIINYLKCEFYRINEETLEITKINEYGHIEKKEKNCWDNIRHL